MQIKVFKHSGVGMSIAIWFPIQIIVADPTMKFFDTFVKCECNANVIYCQKDRLRVRSNTVWSNRQYITDYCTVQYQQYWSTVLSDQNWSDRLLSERSVTRQKRVRCNMYYIRTGFFKNLNLRIAGNVGTLSWEIFLTKACQCSPKKSASKRARLCSWQKIWC